MILLFKDSKHAVVNKITSYLCNMIVCYPGNNSLSIKYRQFISIIYFSHIMLQAHLTIQHL